MSLYDFWEQRYQETGYAYGEAPNVFFKQFIDTHPPGRILLPGEGEGRNAVYAALNGWQVDAYDYSQQAIKNAQKFAEKNKVQVNFMQASHDDLSSFTQVYDAIALIYVHVNNQDRANFHQRLSVLLKPQARFIIEAFTPEQLANSSGGPKDIDMLYNLSEVCADFSDGFDLELSEELVTKLDEGKYHVGMANFIRLIAKKH